MAAEEFVPPTPEEVAPTPEEVDKYIAYLRGARTMANRKHDEEFVPPTPDEVDAYIAYLGWPADFDGWVFCDYYEAQGWVTAAGREVKAWRPLVRQWLRNPREWA